MPGVIPDAGELRMLQTVLGVVASESLSLRLYVNNVTPALTDVVGDYTEMSTHGYAAMTLAAGDWSLTPAEAGTNTPARAVTPIQTFVFSTAGAPVSVYGYHIVGATSGILWGAERFADGPYTVQNAGDEIAVTPTVRLRSEYP